MFNITKPEVTETSKVPTEQVLKWFWWNQNNSGGYMAEPAQHIWIQAYSEGQAQAVFDSLDVDTSFCPCCGERWDYPDECEGSVPDYYGTPLNELVDKPSNWSETVPWGLLVFADGTEKKLEIK